MSMPPDLSTGVGDTKSEPIAAPLEIFFSPYLRFNVRYGAILADNDATHCVTDTATQRETDIWSLTSGEQLRWQRTKRR